MKVLCIVLTFIAVAQGAGLFSIGYYPFYEMGGTPPTNIDYAMITHVALGAVSTDSSGNIVVADYVTSMSAWHTFVNTVKPLATAAGTKTILMFGGAGENVGCPGNFNSAASTANVALFAQNLVAHAQSLNFDGIDLDWEDCIDFAGVQRLAANIRSLWPSVFLTFPVGVLGVSTAGGTTDPANYLGIVPYVDSINMMSYIASDNWSGWDGPWHLSPLTGDTTGHPYSIQLALNAFVAIGIPRSKIAIGMGFFGSCWGSPIATPVQALGTNRLKASDNSMSYANIQLNYRSSMVDHYDTTAQVPYLSSTTQVGTAGCSYISYDNDKSIKAKADFVNAQGLTGVIIWTVAQGRLSNGSNLALSSVNAYFGRSYVAITWSNTTSAIATSAAAATMTSTTTTTTTGMGSTTGSSDPPATPGAGYNAVMIYTDSLADGWVDGSWATHSLSNPSPVYSGVSSISFYPVYYDALYFYCPTLGCLSPDTQDGIQFQINGGAWGGQNIVFDIIQIVNGAAQRVPGGTFTVAQMVSGGTIPINTWAQGYVSFSGLASGTYDGFWFSENAGSTQNAVYIDEIQLNFKSNSSSGIVVSPAAPSSSNSATSSTQTNPTTPPSSTSSATSASAPPTSSPTSAPTQTTATPTAPADHETGDSHASKLAISMGFLLLVFICVI